MKVNDLIFKELLRRGYSLEGNTRVWNIADSKLWYLEEEQAKAYLNIDSVKGKKGSTHKEFQLIKKHVGEISQKVLNGSGINIIDIGCGDGLKAIPCIDALAKQAPVRYCPIDISSYMVTEAIKNIREAEKREVIEFRWNISDFDNLENISALLRDDKFRKNFFLFLGGTVNNFELHEVMHEIAEAMDGDIDSLLIGMGLKTDNDEAVAKRFGEDIHNNFLGQILTQIGFKEDELEFGTRLKNSRIESYYTVKKDKKVILGDKFIAFYKGDQILVATIRRYSKEEFEEAMRIYFSEVEFFPQEDGSRALVLCKK